MTLNIVLLIILLFFLVLLSGFFSGSETGMMSLNRYRLRHMARDGNVKAKRVSALLERPDRILGVILLGNTFANILASSVATMLAVSYLGKIGVVVVTVVLTFVILVFAETAPKTLAAVHPMRVAFFSEKILRIFLFFLYPFVVAINTLANGFLRLFNVRVKKTGIEPLSAEELRTVVNEAMGKITSSYQQMLLKILDLEQMTVEDVMVPRTEIVGINLDDSWREILKQLQDCEHANVPLYRESIDKVCGMLNLRKVLISIQKHRLNKESMIALADPVYFIPAGALIGKQLLNFQRERKTVGLVVDEYGDMEGLITLRDIIEEIVGEFAFDVEEFSKMIKKQKDGSYLVNGNISIRDLNRIMRWSLPMEGPKTLSGLVIENLETIPEVGITTELEGYSIEVLEMSENTVQQVRIRPSMQSDSKTDPNNGDPKKT